MKRANGGLFAMGITFLILGPAGMATGGVLMGMGGQQQGLAMPIGAVAFFVSGGVLAAGIPLTVIGGKRVPDDGPATGVDWRPAVVASPGGGGLRWTF